MIDLDLAAAPAPGADPDRRDPQALGDRAGELLRDELEHDREGARLLDGEGVGEQRACLLAVLPWTRTLPRGVPPAASTRCGP